MDLILVLFLWYLGNELDILNMGSFLLQEDVCTRIQFQASLLIIHISQDSVSCIVGKHDTDSLSENVVVLCNKQSYLYFQTEQLYYRITISANDQ